MKSIKVAFGNKEETKKRHSECRFYWASLYDSIVQSNLDSSNTDGSFTMDISISFLSPYEILPTAQENKYFGKRSYLIIKVYVVCTHLNRLIEAILMSILNIQLLCRRSKKTFLYYSHLSPNLALWLTLSGSNYLCVEQISMVPKMFEPLKLNCSLQGCTWPPFFCEIRSIDFIEALHMTHQENMPI